MVLWPVKSHRHLSGTGAQVQPGERGERLPLRQPQSRLPLLPVRPGAGRRRRRQTLLRRRPGALRLLGRGGPPPAGQHGDACPVQDVAAGGGAQAWRQGAAGGAGAGRRQGGGGEVRQSAAEAAALRGVAEEEVEAREASPRPAAVLGLREDAAGELLVGWRNGRASEHCLNRRCKVFRV